MPHRVFAAVDIGASGGRVMAGIVDDAVVALETVHRFPNAAARRDGHLRWDLSSLYGEVLIGLRTLGDGHPNVESIGIDTWGVDYGLLGADGTLLAEPIAYRDDRTADAVARVHARVSAEELYEINGLQFLPFNTLYQLDAEAREPRWAHAAHVVLLPDLLAFWLTGELLTEATNASTTGLVDVRTGDWSLELLDRLGIDPTRLPPIEQPGTVRGALRPSVAAELGLRPNIVVTSVGSHDTASAVVGVPAITEHFAYIGSGTWSLVGLELDKPVVTAESRVANFTNEAGVDGRTRFLRNVGGLWLLQESLRTWAEQGDRHDLGDLLAAAAALSLGGPTIDVDDIAYLAPGGMPERIAAAIGGRVELPPPVLVRCILDSLAVAYARTVDEAAVLAGEPVEVVHVVGGGSQNELLCQLSANALDRPLASGPVEATALGNILVQARAHGATPSSLEAMRALLSRSMQLRTYEPAT